MLKLILACFALLASSVVTAAPVTLSLDYESMTNIDGFRVYCGGTTQIYDVAPVVTFAKPVKSVSVTFTTGSKQFCVARAYNVDGESPNSNEISFTVPLDAPTNFRITMLMSIHSDGSVTLSIERIRKLVEVVGVAPR